MAVDNFEIIGSLMDFSRPNTMYFIQILKRRKDNPDMTTGVKVIDNYYINSIEDLVKLKDRIVNDCNERNARAYINLNRLDTLNVAKHTIKIIIDYILNEQYAQVKNAYATACGTHHSEPRKKWVVDIDTKDEDEIQAVTDYINALYIEAKSDNKILASIPTKNGVHLISEGFNMKKFMDTFPGMTVTKNSPTVLYIPGI